MQYHKNQSTLVYDKKVGGSYIEPAIYSWGVSDEQLLNTVARHQNDGFRNYSGMKCPRTIAELENDEEPDHYLKMFLGLLKNTALKDSTKCLSLDFHVLSSLVKSFISGRRSIFKAKLSCATHGMTKCRKLVGIFKKIEIRISYKDVTNLYATREKQAVESGSCPFKLLMTYPE